MPDAPQEILDQIAAEYESTVLIPPGKPSPQWMLLPVGLIGSGKTTVVKALSARLNLVRLCTDDVRKLLKERGYSYEGCRDVILGLLTKYLNQGYSVALDANTGSSFGLEYNERSKKEFPNVRQIYIHVNPPEEFILTHLVKPGNHKFTWLFKDGEDAIARYKANKEAFTMPDLPFTYIFDPSKDTIPQQIKEGAQAIERELHTI